MVGVQHALLVGVAFTPVLRVYTSGSSSIETAPAGATNVYIEVWGGNGGGGGGNNVIAIDGGGGGSGSYGSSTYAITGGQTLSYTVGAGGNGGLPGANGSQGGASIVSSGTATITTIITNGGPGGSGGSPLASGSAAAGIGGNVANTAGNSSGTSPLPPPGASPVTGVYYTPAGAGGTGGIAFNNGLNGDGGAVSFYYT